MERWDAGDIGCSRLITALRERVRQLPPDGTIEVIARDPGAWIDLPAWCRMTGHELVSAEPPVYVIRRKAD